MATQVHPTAIVEPGAQLGADAAVGPYAYVGAQVRLGPGCRLLHHAAVTGRTTLGAGNTVHPGAVIGGPPQDLKYTGEDTELVVGERNTFRECVTVNLGTAGGGGRTTIGNDCLLMAYVHVAHDCVLEDRVVLANSVQLAGHIRVEYGAILSGLSAAHHFVTIGRLSFIGGMSAVRTDVPPFMLVEGNPARVRNLNLVGLHRHKVPDQSIAALKKVFRLAYRDNLPREQVLDRVETMDIRSVDEVRALIQSFRATQAGRHGRALEATRTDRNGGGVYRDNDGPQPPAR